MHSHCKSPGSTDFIQVLGRMTHLTYCSVFIEVQKGSKLILRKEPLPIPFWKTSQKRVSHPDQIVEGLPSNSSGSTSLRSDLEVGQRTLSELVLQRSKESAGIGPFSSPEVTYAMYFPRRGLLVSCSHCLPDPERAPAFPSHTP